MVTSHGCRLFPRGAGNASFQASAGLVKRRDIARRVVPPAP